MINNSVDTIVKLNTIIDYEKTVFKLNLQI